MESNQAKSADGTNRKSRKMVKNHSLKRNSKRKKNPSSAKNVQRSMQTLALYTGTKRFIMRGKTSNVKSAERSLKLTCL